MFSCIRDMFRAAILLSRTAQKSKIQTALFKKKNAFLLKTSKPMVFYIFFYVMKIKTQNCV